MNIEQVEKIKSGDKILVEVEFHHFDEDGDAKIISSNSEGDDFMFIDPKHIVCVVGETTNAESSPKYDPCRRFKKGDKVRVVAWNGRNPDKTGKILFCTDNEYENGLVPLKENADDFQHKVHACNLELVTPVEELAPYKIEEDKYVWKVMHTEQNAIMASFWKSFHPYAKEAAEAERDRLNAEYRKEQTNA